jgi:hypothetical protein
MALKLLYLHTCTGYPDFWFSLWGLSRQISCNYPDSIEKSVSVSVQNLFKTCLGSKQLRWLPRKKDQQKGWKYTFFWRIGRILNLVSNDIFSVKPQKRKRKRKHACSNQIIQNPTINNATTSPPKPAVVVPAPLPLPLPDPDPLPLPDPLLVFCMTLLPVSFLSVRNSVDPHKIL